MSMENIAGARKPAKREDERTVAGEHRMMRRADREVTDPEQIAAIIAACDIVEVAYADAEGLAIVPLNFGFDYEYDEADGVAATVLVNGAETVGSTGVVAADEVGCPGKLTLWFHSAPHMPHVEFTDAQVRSVTVWKIEVDYFTTKVRAKPAPAHIHQRPAVPRAGVIGAR